MILIHRFDDEALAEFIEAGRYFNRQVPGLGDDFVDESNRAFGRSARPHLLGG